jgi:hypothetical protein
MWIWSRRTSPVTRQIRSWPRTASRLRPHRESATIPWMGALIHVTAWERVSIGRRLLCAFARVATLIALLLALLLALGSVYFRYHYPLEAKIWHWKHGYSTTMGNYEVPVPEHWLIANENSVAFTLMNSAPNVPRDANFHMTAMITVFPFRLRSIGPDRVAFWLSQQRQLLAREKVESVEEKTLKFGDESITCIGGRELSAGLRSIPNRLQSKPFPETDIISLNCVSEGGLHISFTGEPSDLQSFYAFVSEIRRKK